MARSVLSMLMLVLLSFVPTPSRAASVTSTWLGGTGAWTDANWSDGVPQNTATDSFDAVVDGGNATASEVTLDSEQTIDSLTVDPGDSLILTPNAQLTVVGNLIQNAGDIVIHGQSLYPGGIASNDGTLVLSGGGTLHLDGGDIGALGTTHPPALVNADNTIAGSGLIRAEDFENHGVVEANVAGQILMLGMMSMRNEGTLRAADGGVMTAYLYSSIDNTGGVIEAIRGGAVQLPDEVIIRGGTFSAIQSHFGTAGQFDAVHFVTDENSQIDFAGPDSAALSDVTLDGQYGGAGVFVTGTLTNHGLFSGELVPDGSVTILNQGHVILPFAESAARGGDLTFTGGGTVALEASASPLPPEIRAPFRNLDNAIRGAGSFRNLTQNGGLIEAANGSLTVQSASGVDHSGVFAATTTGSLEMLADVTGSGSWRADGGTIHLTGNVSTTGDVAVLHGGALVVDTGLSAHDLVIDATGSIDIQGMLRVAGNVDFDGPGAGRFSFGPGGKMLASRGGGAAVGDWTGWQSFEVAGEDLGAVPAGFTAANAYLPDLVIGADGRLYFRDGHDNGNRSAGAPEAIYVDTLEFTDSLGLLDLNGIKLYYNHLVGSLGQIIDVPLPVPEPAPAALLGLALLGLWLLRSGAAAQEKQHQEHRDRDPDQPQEDPADLSRLVVRMHGSVSLVV